jgi:hypothetical protein
MQEGHASSLITASFSNSGNYTFHDDLNLEIDQSIETNSAVFQVRGQGTSKGNAAAFSRGSRAGLAEVSSDFPRIRGFTGIHASFCRGLRGLPRLGLLSAQLHNTSSKETPSGVVTLQFYI